VRSTVSQEAVQEFQIITNSYAAEYGRAAGGVVNIITRSGSNDFHGDVYGYLRNRDFQAVNPFATCAAPPCSNPAYTRVQAGAAFGARSRKTKHTITLPMKSPGVTKRDSPALRRRIVLLSAAAFDATTSSILRPSGNVHHRRDAAASGVPPDSGPAQCVAQQYAFLAVGIGIALAGAYPASFGLLAEAGAIPTPSNAPAPYAIPQFLQLS